MTALNPRSAVRHLIPIWSYLLFGSACNTGPDETGADQVVQSPLIRTATRVSADGQYTLYIDNRDPRLADAIINNLANNFFATYPVVLARWNSDAAKTITFVFRPPAPDEEMAPAYTDGTTITYNSQYLIANPNDWDVVVHEETHVVQAGFKGPGWLIEGQADYARDAYGRNNAAQDWSLDHVDLTRNYTAGYGEAAAFIKWLEKYVRGTMMNDLSAAMRAGTYSDATWTTLTGRTVVQLWNLYNPTHPIPEAGVTFFQHTDYEGYAVTLTRGGYTLAQLRAAGIGVVKDRPEDLDTSSIKVSPGFSVIVYANDNYYNTPGNSSWWFNANTPDFTNVTVNGMTWNINDIVSSVWIY